MTDQSVKYYSATEKPLILTEAAIVQFKKQLHRQHGCCGVRLTLKEAGCSGMKYVLDFVSEVVTTDLQIVVDPELTVYVDVKGYPFIKGMTIDFVREGLNAQFTYSNPNQSGACGCGESFFIDGQN